MNKDDIDKLINDHWAYVKALIKNETEAKDEGVIRLYTDEYFNQIEFHYKTAFRHGFKHGIDAGGKK